jgi:hypothetical protein
MGRTSHVPTEAWGSNSSMMPTLPMYTFHAQQHGANFADPHLDVQ